MRTLHLITHNTCSRYLHVHIVNTYLLWCYHICIQLHVHTCKWQTSSHTNQVPACIWQTCQKTPFHKPCSWWFHTRPTFDQPLAKLPTSQSKEVQVAKDLAFSFFFFFLESTCPSICNIPRGRTFHPDFISIVCSVTSQKDQASHPSVRLCTEITFLVRFAFSNFQVFPVFLDNLYNLILLQLFCHSFRYTYSPTSLNSLGNIWQVRGQYAVLFSHPCIV